MIWADAWCVFNLLKVLFPSACIFHFHFSLFIGDASASNLLFFFWATWKICRAIRKKWFTDFPLQKLFSRQSECLVKWANSLQTMGEFRFQPTFGNSLNSAFSSRQWLKPQLTSSEASSDQWTMGKVRLPTDVVAM
jgi:hypothetical protein